MIPGVSRNFFRGKFFDVAEVNQRFVLQESGQWLENVDRTHLVLASGKPVLQKRKEKKMIHFEIINPRRTLYGVVQLNFPYCWSRLSTNLSKGHFSIPTPP